MVVSMPRKGLVQTEAPDMVRVQLKPNDIRSYRRWDAEEILAQTPGAFILGESPDAEDDEAPKGHRAARNSANKAREPKATPKDPPTAPAETKTDEPPAPPAEPPSE